MNVTKISFFTPNRAQNANFRQSAAFVATKNINTADSFTQNLSFGIEYARDIYASSKQGLVSKRRRELTDLMSAPPEEGKELSKFDETIVKNIDTVVQFAKGGVPLKYSRERFIDNYCDMLPFTKKGQVSIVSRTGIQSIVGGSKNKRPKEYNGILYLDELDTRNTRDKRYYDEIANFIYKNEVKTGNRELDETLNAIIKGMPEFVNCIGKKQHEAHDYTLDVHSLVVLANVIKDPRYKTLSEDDKFVLKMTALLHDIAKREGERDPNHPAQSETLCRTFIQRYNLTPQMNDRILKSIGGHQWLRTYNMFNASEKMVNNHIRRYDSPNDYIMSMIFTKADLAATSKEINDLFSPLLEYGPQEPMRKAVEAKFGVKL